MVAISKKQNKAASQIFVYSLCIVPEAKKCRHIDIGSRILIFIAYRGSHQSNYFISKQCICPYGIYEKSFGTFIQHSIFY